MKLFTTLAPIGMLLLSTTCTVVALEAETFIINVIALTGAITDLDNIIQEATSESTASQHCEAVHGLENLQIAFYRVLEDLREPSLEQFPRPEASDADEVVFESMRAGESLFDDLIRRHDVIATVPAASHMIYNILSEGQSDLAEALPALEHLLGRSFYRDPNLTSFQSYLQGAIYLYEPKYV